MKFIKEFREYLNTNKKNTSLQDLDEYLVSVEADKKLRQNLNQVHRRELMRSVNFDIKSKYGYRLIQDGVLKSIFDNIGQLIQFLKADYDIEYTFNDVYLSSMRYRNKSKSGYVNEKNRIKFQGIEIDKFLN